MKVTVPHDLPPTPFLGHLKEQIGDMDVGWDITIKDVERLRQFLTPTIHTLPNLETLVQPYMPLGPVHDKEKIVREEEQDYDIPLHDDTMEPLTPQTFHIKLPDDDYVAPATSPTLDKQLNEFWEECSDITRVADKANGNHVKDVQDLSDIKTYDCETFIQKLLHQDPAARRKILRPTRPVIVLWFCWISFDYHVPLGFGSIVGGLDHVIPVIRLPIEHGINRGTRVGNVTISQVYYVEGLGHNLFSVGHFCDSDLEVAFQKHTYFVYDLEGVDLLKGSRGINLLSHLNFDTINELAKQGLVRGLPKLKYQKDHLCFVCSLGKSKKHTQKPKSEDFIQEKLYLLHMDLCGLMRIESINGKNHQVLSRTPVAVVALILVDTTGTPSSSTVDQDAPTASTSLTHADFQEPVLHKDESTSRDVIESDMHTNHQSFEHISKWTKDHPLDNVIRNPSRPVSTRKQLQIDPMWCYFDAFLTSVEPKNYKEALKESSWIEAMHEEINEFERLQDIRIHDLLLHCYYIRSLSVTLNPYFLSLSYTAEETNKRTLYSHKEIDLETAQTNATEKFPIIKQGEYEMWRLRIEQYFQVQDYALWDVIENSNSFKPTVQTTTNVDGTSTSIISGLVTTEEKA
ncbi:hypothetical protein Tco_0140422 [Tanacetum coccineum]